MADLLRKINYLPIWRNYMRVWGMQMFHPSWDRWLYLILHRMGFMSVVERKTIESILRPEMVVLDVGGNIGLYTILFSQLVGEKGSVLTVEPVPELRDALEKSIEKNQIKNVKILPFAAGSQAGWVCFNLDALNSGNNWIATGAKPATALKIPIQRLDALSLDRPIDFVKIDVQGWEIEVLKGMSGLIQTGQRPIIMCEIHKQSLEMAGASVRELGQLLLDYHYELCLPLRRDERIEMEILSLPALEERAARTLYFDIIARPS